MGPYEPIRKLETPSVMLVGQKKPGLQSPVSWMDFSRQYFPAVHILHADILPPVVSGLNVPTGQGISTGLPVNLK